MKHHHIYGGLMLALLTMAGAEAAWQRSPVVITPPVHLFHSTHAINLPSAETLSSGEFEYEISHRFIPAASQGLPAFYGIDGPANIRWSLTYGLSDELMLSFGRGNYQDNYDLNARMKITDFSWWLGPSVASVQGGSAVNAQVTGRDVWDSRNIQYYGQFILNVMPAPDLAVGVVPTYVHNSDITRTTPISSFTCGTYLQYHAGDTWSYIVEWIPTVGGYRSGVNTMSYAMQAETGGHFFKWIFSNNAYLNSTQVVTGADFASDWHLGFMITRVLKL